ETFLDLSQEISAAELTRTDPDVVLIVPGPGISTEFIRRVGWALEETRTSLVLQTHLDGIASHRLVPTSYAGTNLMRIRSSRPAMVSRLAKATVDRVVGAL